MNNQIGGDFKGCTNLLMVGGDIIYVTTDAPDPACCWAPSVGSYYCGGGAPWFDDVCPEAMPDSGPINARNDYWHFGGSCKSMFEDCTSLLSIGNLEGHVQGPGTAGPQPLGGPFSPIVPFYAWLPHVTNMESMFKNCSRFTGQLGGWGVSEVTSFAHMFDGAQLFTARPSYIPPAFWAGNGVQMWAPNPAANTTAMFGTTAQDAAQAWVVWGTLSCFNNGSPVPGPHGPPFFFECWPPYNGAGGCCSQL